MAEPIQIVDLYPLMCEVLRIKPAPNNGSLARVQHFLIDRLENSATPRTITLISSKLMFFFSEKHSVTLIKISLFLLYKCRLYYMYMCGIFLICVM